MKTFTTLIAKPSAVTPVLAGLVLLHVAFCAVASGQTDVTNEVQVLSKVAFMGKAVSNELVNISTNEKVASDLRQYAASVLANHDTAGTNAYDTLESFIAGWSITNEPPVSSNLIATMKKTLEYGISGKAQLTAFAANTNMPAQLRQIADKMLHNLGGGNCINWAGCSVSGRSPRESPSMPTVAVVTCATVYALRMLSAKRGRIVTDDSAENSTRLLRRYYKRPGGFFLFVVGA